MQQLSCRPRLWTRKPLFWFTTSARNCDVFTVNLDQRDLCSLNAGISGPLVYFRLTRLIYGAINLSSVIRRKVGSQDFHGPLSNEFNIRRGVRGRVRFSYNIGTRVFISLYMFERATIKEKINLGVYQDINLRWVDVREKNPEIARGALTRAKRIYILYLFLIHYRTSCLWPYNWRVHLFNLFQNRIRTKKRVQCQSSISIIEKWKTALLLRHSWEL